MRSLEYDAGTMQAVLVAENGVSVRIMKLQRESGRLLGSKDSDIRVKECIAGQQGP